MMGKRFVFSVVVTYGKRFHLLKQVVDACINEGIEKIIVVDNDSENREELDNARGGFTQPRTNLLSNQGPSFEL